MTFSAFAGNLTTAVSWPIYSIAPFRAPTSSTARFAELRLHAEHCELFRAAALKLRLARFDHDHGLTCMLCTEKTTRHPCATADSLVTAADEIKSAIRLVLSGKRHTDRVGERRREHRTPYPYLIKLAPVSADGETPAGEGMVVVGKHLSVGGIDFYHREPLPYRWVIAWLETGGAAPQAVLVELLWCRFNKQGWYENGGRFVRLIDGAVATKEFPK